MSSHCYVSRLEVRCKTTPFTARLSSASVTHSYTYLPPCSQRGAPESITNPANQVHGAESMEKGLKSTICRPSFLLLVFLVLPRMEGEVEAYHKEETVDTNQHRREADC